MLSSPRAWFSARTRHLGCEDASKQYFLIDPEVAGGLGENSVVEPGQKVTRLHYEFEGWLGDCLCQTWPCYILSEAGFELATRSGLTGFGREPVEISKSEQFEMFYPDRVVPPFVWLTVTGKAGQADFGLTERSKLVVSEAALELLRSCGLEQADVEVSPG